LADAADHNGFLAARLRSVLQEIENCARRANLGNAPILWLRSEQTGRAGVISRIRTDPFFPSLSNRLEQPREGRSQGKQEAVEDFARAKKWAPA